MEGRWLNGLEGRLGGDSVSCRIGHDVGRVELKDRRSIGTCHGNGDHHLGESVDVETAGRNLLSLRKHALEV